MSKYDGYICSEARIEFIGEETASGVAHVVSICASDQTKLDQLLVLDSA